MADAEEPVFTTLAQRIAALKQSQGGRHDLGGKEPPLPFVKQAKDNSRPQIDFRSNSINNPPTSNYASSVTKQVNNQPASAKSDGTLPRPPNTRDVPTATPQLPNRKQPPALPARQTSHQAYPVLPPRKPSSNQLSVRRDSNDSTVSQNSTISTFSLGQSIASSASSVGGNDGRRLPPTLDQANLPPLPPTKRDLANKARLEQEAQAQMKTPLISAKSAPIVPRLPARQTSMPALPPRMPPRPTRVAQVAEPVAISTPSKLRILPHTTNPVVTVRPIPPTPASLTPISSDDPPPIPFSSRPSRNQLPVQESKAVPRPRPADECLLCRDFSGPDRVASQYPRLSIPSNSTDYLAEALCGPFDSATDKARAIFTWLHYNIDYDVEAFFGNNVCHSTPENTLARGLAVCGGYAGVYCAIALKAGLECVMVTGHGKGYGYSAPKDGDPIPPPNPAGHAWNAVRIDDGEWKLIDSCWGAGNVSTQKYNRKFSPNQFTASNEDFGERHFPAEVRYFFRSDGSAPSWEQYIRGRSACEPLQLYGVVAEYGIKESSFLPPQKKISVTSDTTRFQFSKMCLHWDHVKNGGGLPYCMILQVNGMDGREKDFVAFDYDGTYWWVDVQTKHLGCAPQTVNVYAVTTIAGQDARGVSKKEYLNKKGRQGMGFQTVATWELV